MNGPDERQRSTDGTTQGSSAASVFTQARANDDTDRYETPGQQTRPFGQVGSAHQDAHGHQTYPGYAQQQHDPWATPGGPTPPGGSDDGRGGGGGGGGGRGPGKRPGWLALGGTAVVAALAAAGLTAGLVGAFGHNDGGGSGTVSSAASSSSAPIQGVSETTVNWQSVVDAVSPSVVSVTVASGTAEGEGSGIVLDTSGRIVTNNHVVTGAGTAAKITVTLSDGREFNATIVGTDPATDIAVIKLDNPPSDLKAATFADSDKVVAGQAVMALGNPLGLAGSATTGIVSALDRPVVTEAESSSESQQNPFGQQQQQTTAETVATNAIQTDAAINPGNSGGALLDSSGRVIGINSSIASLSDTSSATQSGSIGLGFAIPANEVKMIADQLVTSGTAQHAWLGVSLTQQDATVTANGATRTGAQVAAVDSGTPAADAGVQTGDVITAVDSQATDGYESLTATIRGKAVGSEAKLTVVRNGQEQTLTATLTARPAS